MAGDLDNLLKRLSSITDNLSTQAGELWWDEAVPHFLDLLQKAVWTDSGPGIIYGWQEWLERKAPHFLNAVSGENAERQRYWLRRLLEAALKVRQEQWTSQQIPDEAVERLAEELSNQYEASAAAFPLAFWRDLLWELGNLRITPGRQREVLFPLVVKGQGILAKFHLELLPSGDGQVFLAPAQVLCRHLGEHFAAIFLQASSAARSLSKDGSQLRDVRVRIEPDNPGEKTYLEQRILQGPSAGGALALGLWSLWQGVPLDTGIVVSFALCRAGTHSPDGKCHPIGSDIEKAQACLDSGLKTFLVAAQQGKQVDHWALPRGLEVKGVRTIQKATEVASGIADALKKYYKALIARLGGTGWHHLDGRAMRLRDIDIPVRVLKEETAHPSKFDEERRQEPALRRIDPEVARYYEEPTLEKRRVEVKWEDERGAARCAVILGAPGGGKTFLTKVTVVDRAKEGLRLLEEGRPLEQLPLPVHLDLASLARTVRGRQEEPQDSIVRLVRPNFSSPSSFWTWFSSRLSSPQAWLVLDALDQVTQDQRADLLSWLKSLDDLEWQCRRLLTCRSANYDRTLLPWRQATEYELAPFEYSEARRFVGKWFAGDPEKSSRLITVLDNSYALARACRSPLVSTLTCMAHDEQPLAAGLRRSELYDRVMRMRLKRQWQISGGTLEDTEVDERLWVLERAAWDLFVCSPETNQFPHREVHRILDRAIRESDLSFKAKDLKDELLDAGMLVKAGEGRGEVQLSFMHRSFFEYLAARFLASQIKTDGWPATEGLIDKKAWHPAWWEVVKFLAGVMEDPTPLLATLANADADDYFRHRLVLAAQCVAETRIAPDDARLNLLVDEIAKEALLCWTRWLPEDYDFRSSQTTSVLSSLIRSNAHVEGMPLVKSVRALLYSDDAKVRLKATAALRDMSGLVLEHPDVADALADRLRHDRTAKVREVAAQALGAMGEIAGRQPEVLEAITDRVLHDDDFQVSLAAAKALGKMGEMAAKHPDLIPALVADLRAEDEYGPGPSAATEPPRGTARLIGAMGAAAGQHPAVIPALLDCLFDEKNLREESGGLLWIAKALGAMGEEAKRQHQVTNVLVGRLLCGDKENWKARVAAAVALCEIPELRREYPDVVTDLLDCLEKDESLYGRAAAALVLGPVGEVAAEHPKVIPALVRALLDEAREVRGTAAEALGEMGDLARKHPEVVDALVDCLLRDQEGGVRIAAINALGLRRVAGIAEMWNWGAVAEVAERYPRVVPALLDRLLSDEDAEVRVEAATTLGAIGASIAKHREAVPALVRCLLHDQDEGVREEAARALGALSEVWGRDQKAIQALVGRALHDDHSAVRHLAATALGRTIKVEGHDTAWFAPVVERLLHDLLREEGRQARSGAAWALAMMGEVAAREHPEVITSLVNLSHKDGDPEMRFAATAALGWMGEVGRRRHDVIQTLVDQAVHGADMNAADALATLLTGGRRLFLVDGRWRVRTVAELSGEAQVT